MPDGPADQWFGFLAALETTCPACSGTGQVRSEAWQAWHERAEELGRVALAAQRASGMRLDASGAVVRAPDDLPRRRRAYATGHSGGDAPTVMAAIERAIDEHERARPLEAEYVTCRTCAGGGLVLTPLGQRLVQFLKRHGLVTGPTSTPPQTPGTGGTIGGRA